MLYLYVVWCGLGAERPRVVPVVAARIAWASSAVDLGLDSGAQKQRVGGAGVFHKGQIPNMQFN